jgi:putative heme iron utilization protein
VLPRKVSKSSIQEKVLLSLIISLVETHVPGSATKYGDSESEVIIHLPQEAGGGRIHFFSYYHYGGKHKRRGKRPNGVLSMITIGLSQDFLLSLSRSVSYILRDYKSVPKICVGRDDESFVPFAANGLCKECPEVLY